MFEDSGNFAGYALRHGVATPEKIALVIPTAWDSRQVHHYTRITYGELYQRVSNYIEGFRQQGLNPGDRVIVLFKPSIDLYAVVLALLAGGMTAVFIDTGMGLKKIYQAISDSKAAAVISMQAFLKYRYLLPTLWKRKLFSVDSTGLFLKPLSVLYREGSAPALMSPCRPESHALITFTSGSTGRPKGADRSHGSLIAQHLAIRQGWPDEDSDIDMPCFPVFVLHNLNCGMTTVMPALDLAKPAAVEPPVIISQAREWGVTRMSGAPAYLGKLVHYLKKENQTIPTLKGIACGGAPVPKQLCQTIVEVFPYAQSAVVYGSTEAEPVAHVEMSEVVQSEGAGLLVGKPVEIVKVEIVALPDEFPEVDEKGVEPYKVAPGEVGEIIVKGTHVLQGYIDNPAADRENKIKCPDGTVWHRMGDTGYWDPEGRIWLVGRRSAIVRHHGKILHPFLIELVVNALEGVTHSALIASSKPDQGLLVFEPVPDAQSALLHSAIQQTLTSLDLSDIPLQAIERMPMDGRHNSKIDRPALKKRFG